MSGVLCNMALVLSFVHQQDLQQHGLTVTTLSSVTPVLTPPHILPLSNGGFFCHTFHISTCIMYNEDIMHHPITHQRIRCVVLLQSVDNAESILKI